MSLTKVCSILGRTLLVVTLLAVGARAASAATTIGDFTISTAASQPNTEIPGPDGNLWFVELNGNNVGRITPAGVMTEFPVPTPASQPSVITQGPDGNLWFTEAAGNKIAKITMTGQITEFPIATPASTPEVIVTGPDGNLWFAEKDGNTIGMITPAGAITEFPVLTAASQPIRIISGNDGNLWFLESAGNNIGRITTAGVVSEFPIPTAASQPQQIINGPDGNLWFVEQAGNRIGRITPAGMITEFPLHTPNSQPTRIVLGRDNNLWFTEANNHAVGQITPAGVITEVMLTRGSGPNRIHRGRDANLWVTENASNKVARVTYAGGVTEFSVPTANTGFTELLTSYDGNIWYVGATGNVIGRIVDDAFNAATLAAAVLPGSRSVQLGATATAFATVINAGNTTATTCEILDTLVRDPENFFYQTTDPHTNALSGTPNTPVSIPAGQFQTFVFAMTPTGPFVPDELRLTFSCGNVGSAPFAVGVNTFLLSASNTPVPDIVALVATLSGDGILHVPGASGANAFAVATANVGAGSTLSFSADTGAANLPLIIDVCQTNPVTGSCISNLGPSVDNVIIGAGTTPTFAVVVQATGPVLFDPANSRIFARFRDANGVIRGETSVAVTTAF
jgi:streptogramin lyase